MPKNEENLYLYSKLRLDTTNKGMTEFWKDIKTIQDKLDAKGTKIKLTPTIDMSVGAINKAISDIQTKFDNAKKQKPLRIPVDIDVKGSAKAISDQLKTVKKVLDQWSQHQHQAQQKIQASVVNPNAVGTPNANAYLKGVKEAKKLMTNTLNDGTKDFERFSSVSSKALTDAEGNLKGFTTKLDTGKGVAEQWTWAWNSVIEVIDGVETDMGHWGVQSKTVLTGLKQNARDVESAFIKLYEAEKKYTGNNLDKEQYRAKIQGQFSEAKSKGFDGSELEYYNNLTAKIKDLNIERKVDTQERLKQQALIKNADYNKLNTLIKTNDIENLKLYTRQLGILDKEIGEISVKTNNERNFSTITATEKGIGDTVQQVTYKIDHQEKAITKMSDATVHNMNRNLGVWEQLKIAMARFPVWMLATTAYYGTARAIRAMATEIFELDKSLTELKRVANDGLNIDSLFKNTLKLSQDLGNNIHNVMDTVNEFARTFGDFNEEQLLAITRTATIMSNVSDLSAQEAGETLVGTMKAFNVTAEESIRIVDSFNEVDNQFAISTKQIAEGMEKSASVAKTFGVTLEENVGNITSIGAVTQESGKFKMPLILVMI